MESQERMSDNDIIEAFDILDKFEFFGGQRAGRLLWFNKPADIQEKDIGGFNRDIDFLKAFIDRQKAEIEALKLINSTYEADTKRVRDIAIEEVAEKLKSHKRRMCGNDNGGLYWDQAVLVDDIDRVMKELTEEKE